MTTALHTNGAPPPNGATPTSSSQHQENGGSVMPIDPTVPPLGPDTQVVPRHGVLTIRLSAARKLALPLQLPVAIEEALRTPQGQNASSLTPSSVLEERSKKYYANGNNNNNNGTAPSDRAPNRESIQRKQCWWLPYVVLAFDNSEIMVDALGGNIAEPVWMYAAHL